MFCCLPSGLRKGTCGRASIRGIALGAVELKAREMGRVGWKLCEGLGCWRCTGPSEAPEAGVGGTNLDLQVKRFGHFVSLRI